MAKKFFHTDGTELTSKHLRFLKKASKFVGIGWQSIAARPASPLTAHLLDSYGRGESPADAVANYEY